MAELIGSGTSLANFIWKNAEDLWGDFKHTDFGKVILPFTLLRRLECVLEPTRDDMTWSSNNGHFAKPLFSVDIFPHILWG